MNTNIFNIRKVAGLSLLTLMLSGASLSVRAGSGEEKNGAAGNTSANSAEVKYIVGSDGEYLFNVVYNNVSGNRFTLMVLDADGNQLFQSQYSDKKFDKKFRLADPDEFGRLTFVIRNNRDNSVQRFEVNSSSRLIEDIEVKEVK